VATETILVVVAGEITAEAVEVAENIGAEDEINVEVEASKVKDVAVVVMTGTIDVLSVRRWSHPKV